MKITTLFIVILSLFCSMAYAGVGVVKCTYESTYNNTDKYSCADGETRRYKRSDLLKEPSPHKNMYSCDFYKSAKFEGLFAGNQAVQCDKAFKLAKQERANKEKCSVMDDIFGIIASYRGAVVSRYRETGIKSLQWSEEIEKKVKPKEWFTFNMKTGESFKYTWVGEEPQEDFGVVIKLLGNDLLNTNCKKGTTVTFLFDENFRIVFPSALKKYSCFDDIRTKGLGSCYAATGNYDIVIHDGDDFQDLFDDVDRQKKEEEEQLKEQAERKRLEQEREWKREQERLAKEEEERVQAEWEKSIENAAGNYCWAPRGDKSVVHMFRTYEGRNGWSYPGQNGFCYDRKTVDGPDYLRHTYRRNFTGTVKAVLDNPCPWGDCTIDLSERRGKKIDFATIMDWDLLEAVNNESDGLTCKFALKVGFYRKDAANGEQIVELPLENYFVKEEYSHPWVRKVSVPISDFDAKADRLWNWKAVDGVVFKIENLSTDSDCSQLENKVYDAFRYVGVFVIRKETTSIKKESENLHESKKKSYDAELKQKYSCDDKDDSNLSIKEKRRRAMACKNRS